MSGETGRETGAAELSAKPLNIKLGAAVNLALQRGASLYGANLCGANLGGANLDGAIGVIDAGAPNGWRTVGWRQDGWLAVRVGCRNKRLAEAREYWGPLHIAAADRREVLAALDYIEAVARLRGWKTEAEGR